MRAALVLLLLSCTAFAESPATALKLTGKEGDLGGRAPAATMIVLNVNAMVVEGVVRQRFRNDTDQFVEATWLQALPANAAVHEFSVAIGERRIVSEVRARPEAQQVYTAARAAGAAAAIVDADHRNGFSTRIANVAPGEWVETELKFDQVLTFSEGLFQLEFPLAIHSKDAQIRAGICESVADTGPNACSAQLRAVDIVVHLNPGLKIDRVEPATHAIDVGYAGDTLEISLKEGPVPDDRDFALTWQPSPSAQPVAALMTETAADGHYALLMVVPPTQPTESIKRELILVIDTSGSMFGDAMTQAKAAAHDALLRLEAGDRFNVIAFSDVTRALYPEPQPASRQKVDEALNFVEAFSADGGTEMVAALERALSGTAPAGYVRQVVFATDGEVEREDALLDLIDARLGASRLFPIGIGAAPNAGFLRQFSELGRGRYRVIRQIDQVAGELEALFATLDRPQLANLDLKLPSANESYPRALPDLYHGEPLLVLSKLDAPGGQATLRGDLKRSTWHSKLALTATVADRGIARLWARQKVAALENDYRRRPQPALLETIRALGLAHRLVTRETSLVAVDKAPLRPEDRSYAHASMSLGAVPLLATATAQPLYLALAGLFALIALAVLGRRPS